MKLLIPLIRSLNKKEIELVRCLLNLNGNCTYAKHRLNLFEHIIENSSLSEKNIAEKLYRSSPNTAYFNLKSRLHDDICKCILLLRNDLGSGERHSHCKCFHNMLLTEELIKRGLIKPAKELASETLHHINRHDLHSEKLLFDDFVRDYLIDGRNPEKPPGDNGAAGIQYIRTLERERKIKSIYFQIAVHDENGRNGGKQLDKKMHDAFGSIKKLFYTSRLPILEIYYWLSAIRYNHYLQNYRLACRCGLRLNALLRNKPSLHRGEEMAQVYLETARAELCLNRFDSAAEFAGRALIHAKGCMGINFRALETLFLSCINAKKYYRAQKTLELALIHPCHKVSDFYAAKWKLYHAALEFARGHYRNSLNILAKKISLPRDKSSWLYGFRMLEIMNLAELNRYEIIPYKVKNYKRMLLSRKYEPSPRHETILKTMSILTRSHKLAESRPENPGTILKDRHTASGGYCWNPMGYEVVRFDSWLRQKIAGNSFARKPK